MKWKKKPFNLNFTLFLLGRMVSDTGTSILMMIMPLYIIDSGGSGATLGLFTFVSLVPALLIYPFAGVLGDRANRKKIMVITNFASAGVILGLFVLSHLGHMNLTLLLLGVIIISLLNGFFDPATRGMLPQLVNKDELNKANAQIATLKSLSVLMSPILGALLYTNFGIKGLFLINGCSFVITSLCTLLIKYNHSKRQSSGKGGRAEILADLSTGIQFIWKNPIIRKLCYLYLVIYSFIQPIFSVVFPLFYKTKLVYTDTQYGYLQSISILGMLLGSALVGLIFGKENKMLRPLLVGCSLLITSLLTFSILAFPSFLASFDQGSMVYFVLLAAIFSLFSAANMFINIPIQSFIQKETPDEYMSRVFAIISMITRGGMPLGGLLYGIILNNIEVHWIIIVANLFTLLISIAFFTSFHTNKNIDRNNST